MIVTTKIWKLFFYVIALELSEIVQYSCQHNFAEKCIVTFNNIVFISFHTFPIPFCLKNKLRMTPELIFESV